MNFNFHCNKCFLLQFICPKVRKNRRKFLFYPIGSATLLCISYGIFYDQFDFIYLFSTVVAAGFTFTNLQGLLGKGCCKHTRLIVSFPKHKFMYHLYEIACSFQHPTFFIDFED